ncbi:hypothetical protein NDU88_001994 [Pleurodeles waltl]|uniref:Uncharacterized protein n=1 Tax=Pleurodeles waltl TaxID=8319 RepID=A0AAV7UUW7_PLEWA|nr:hypothetical protein NDU88_001994 [Pleurodeles waltl]
MCRPAAAILESRPLRDSGKASGRRLRHWGRAVLELRRVRRGSARIPLWGNQGSASTGKVPGKVSREPGSAVTRTFSENFGAVSKEVGIAGAATSLREEDKSTPLPQSSVNFLQVGGLGLRVEKRDRAVGGNQGKPKGKTLDQVNYLF